MDRRLPSVAADRRLPPVAVGAVILVASLVDPGATGGPPPSLPLGLPPDKLAHGLAYAVLAWSLTPALRDRVGGVAPSARTLLIAALAVAVATAYGAGIELLQTPLPARRLDPADAVANAAGATVGAVVWLVRVRMGW